MKNKRVIFMGTPEFSTKILAKLIENCNVIGVVTQPDKEVGRKKIITKSPVKVLAEENNIKVLQPKKLKDDYQDILDLNPDIIITCAYGQILPKDLLEKPEYQTINVHASILPKLRGGAPIQRAIMEGYKKTGITIMQTDPGMDSGDIIKIKEIDIADNDTYESLSEKLANLGADLLIEVLPSIFDKTATRTKQEENEVTFAKTITREDEHLDFNKTKQEVYNYIRALYPEPGCYAILDDECVKIYEAYIGDRNCGVNGEIINADKTGIGVSVKDGEIVITKLQFPGKKIMTVKEYVNGINPELLEGKIFK